MQEKTKKSLLFIEQIRNLINENSITLSYKGEISQEIILALLEMTEKKLDSSKTTFNVKSKLFNVMVNCLQNISFHADKSKHLKSNIFTIGQSRSDHTIYTGNAIRKERIPELKDKLNEINKMSEKELTEFYRNWIQTQQLTDQHGIGLGLIDIARKTASDLEYDFENMDDEYSYFSLRTIVKPNKTETVCEAAKSPETVQKSLNQYFNFQQIMEKNEIIFLYASDFSQELTKTLLKFTEKKLSFENLEDLVRKKIFNIMVEMLQNISKNAIDRDNPISVNSPIFMIAESDSNYSLISSNKILSKNIEKIKSRIDQVNQLDSAGLKQLYKETRLNSTFSNVGGAGIGIIDMARKSGHKLTYNFQSLEENNAMFSLLITVSKIYT